MKFCLTKMLYQSLTPRNSTRSAYALAIAGIVVAVCIFFDVPFPRAGTDFARFVATPLWSLRDALGARMTHERDGRMSYDKLQTERAALVEELAQLRREAYVTNALREENRALMTLVGRAEDRGGTIPASVILDAAYSPYDTFIIDAGTGAGVRENMLVRTPEGLALGYVTRAAQDSSTVSLFSAAGVRTNVVLVGSSTLHATLEGRGGSMEIRFPRDSDIPLGTSVIVPSFSGAMVGTVTHVSVNPEDAFQTLYVAAPTTIYTVRYALVDTRHAWSAATGTPATGDGTDPEPTVVP